MIRQRILTGAGLLILALCGPRPAAWAALDQPDEQQPQSQQQQPPPGQQPSAQQNIDYSPAEYNAYMAATKETNPAQRIRLLDDFVAKYPNVSPQLMIPALSTYYKTYYDLKNYPKTIEYADKLLAFGDKVDVSGQLEALYFRTLSFHASFNEKDPKAKEQAARARDAALQGLKVLEKLPKPEGTSQEEFEKNKKQPAALFNYTVGFASLQLKDNKTAVDYFKAALATDPNNPANAVTYFRLGVAYLQMEPPQYMDGFWALARSVALKGQGEAQVRAYLRNQLLRYQQPSCEKLLNDEMNELITLAATSPERPPTYNIPSAADLQKAREETPNFITALKAGGEKAKIMWLATCGLEFPEVGGKVIEVVPGEPVILKLFTAPTAGEIEAGTTPNMEVKVEGQPEARRIQKDSGVRFSGTLVGYDPEPFMLHWDKAKVNPEDIPADKGPAKQPSKRPAKRPAAKKPGA